MGRSFRSGGGEERGVRGGEGALPLLDGLHETVVQGSDVAGIPGKGEGGIGMDGPLKIHQGGVFEPLVMFGKGHEVLELPGA